MGSHLSPVWSGVQQGLWHSEPFDGATAPRTDALAPTQFCTGVDIAAGGGSGLSITPAAPSSPSPRGDAATKAQRILRVVLALFCFEIGLILLMLPWTLLWDNNYFFSLGESTRSFLLSSYVRGGVSGLGVVNLWLAAAETVRLIKTRNR